VSPAPRPGRALHTALVLAGVALLIALVRAVGLRHVIADLRGFGPAMVGVILFELTIDGCNTLAWRCTLPRGAPVGLGKLYWVRQAGVAVNQLTPTATVGGEVVKTLLLRPQLTAARTAASLVATRMSYALGQAVLVLLGLASVLGRLHDTPDLAVAVAATSALTVGGVLTFVWLQRRGIFATAVRVARRLGLAPRLLARLEDGGAALDAHLVAFYRERPWAFVGSLGWHVLGQLVGLGQLAYILAALGHPTAPQTCLAIEAFALVVDSAMFFVPARVGVQEAGRVLVLTTFGLNAATGLAVAVVVRLNQLAVVAIGLASYACLSVARRAAPAASEL